MNKTDIFGIRAQNRPKQSDFLWIEVEAELKNEQSDLMTELQYLREENARLKINSNTIRADISID